jgi:outer membrane murein-binding lipoprotein Lpp
MKRIVLLAVIVCLVAGCGGAPTPEPDLVATQVAVMAAAAATLTADAPTAAPTLTVAPTLTPTVALTATSTPTPSPLPTATRPPRATATPFPPPVGPSLGRFAVVNVRSDDVLNVRVGPGVNYAIAGTIFYYGRDVNVFAGGLQVGDAWWVPVEHGSVSGWANSGYLARQVGTVGDPVAARAAEAIMALKDGNMDRLWRLVHPVKGVRFSPYATVNTAAGGDLVFGASDVRGLMADPAAYRWGAYDGSGLPIDATFREYYDEFVYDVDFVRPDVVGFDQRVGQGNSIDNIADAYPGGVMVEYHFEGFDPQYAGMDWRSLRLVFEEQGGVWYLVGIVHDEWTI